MYEALEKEKKYLEGDGSSLSLAQGHSSRTWSDYTCIYVKIQKGGGWKEKNWKGTVASLVWLKATARKLVSKMKGGKEKKPGRERLLA